MIELYGNPAVIGVKVWGLHGEAAFLDLRTDDPNRKPAAKVVHGRRKPRTGYRFPGHAGHLPGECVHCDVADQLPGATK